MVSVNVSTIGSWHAREHIRSPHRTTASPTTVVPGAPTGLARRDGASLGAASATQSDCMLSPASATGRAVTLTARFDNAYERFLRETESGPTQVVDIARCICIV